MCEMNPKRSKFYRVEVWSSLQLDDNVWEKLLRKIEVELVELEMKLNEDMRTRIHVHEE